jgi:hypothetical protein
LKWKRGLKDALEKKIRASKRLKNDDQRLEGAFEGGGKTHRFFKWPNSHGRPAQDEKFSRNEKFSTTISICGHFNLAFHLMDSARIFSYEICKTHYPMSQSLDDMHASLPDLKYRPPFLLNLLVI